MNKENKRDKKFLVSGETDKRGGEYGKSPKGNTRGERMKQPWRLSPSAVFTPVLQASWPCFRPVAWLHLLEGLPGFSCSNPVFTWCPLLFCSAAVACCSSRVNVPKSLWELPCSLARLPVFSVPFLFLVVYGSESSVLPCGPSLWLHRSPFIILLDLSQFSVKFVFSLNHSSFTHSVSDSHLIV